MRQPATSPQIAQLLRRDFLSLVVACAALVSTIAVTKAEAPPRPNVLIADDRSWPHASSPGDTAINPRALLDSKLVAAQDPRVVVTGRQVRRIEGWTVLISEGLLKDQAEATERAIELLTAHLKEIIRIVPAAAVTHLQTVPLWISPEYPNVRPRAEYHPNVNWLRDNGRDPLLAKGVEFTNVRIFEAETKRMPVFVLHELAHAYHDQVLGFENAEIKAAYEHAKASGKYDKVERFNAPGRPDTFERAYAMTNDREYFAECTEAFFGRNDWFPFDRAQLAEQDPEMLKLLRKLWQVSDE